MSKNTELVKSLKAGDRQGFDMLYRTYSEKLYRYILGIVKNHYDAEDILDETFKKTIENISSLKNDKGFEKWLYKIAKNTAFHHLERKDISASVNPCTDEELDALLNIPDEMIPLPSDYAERKEIASEVAAAVSALSDEQREVVMLKYYSDMTVAEIAEKTGVSQGTVKTRLHLAKKHLAAKLEALKGSGLPVFVPITLFGLPESVKSEAAKQAAVKSLILPKIIAGAACVTLAVGIGISLSRLDDKTTDMGDTRLLDISADDKLNESINTDNEEQGGYTKLETVLTAAADDAGVLIVRDKPDRFEGERVATLPDKSQVNVNGYTVSDDGDVWFNITYDENGSTGWSRGSMLRPESLSMMSASIFSADELNSWRESFTLLQPEESEYISERSVTLSATLYCRPSLNAGIVCRLSQTQATVHTAPRKDESGLEWVFVTCTDDDGVYYEGWVINSVIT